MSKPVTKEEDQPAVIAYRVGQLEKAVKENNTVTSTGFAALHARLDEMTRNYVTHSDFQSEVNRGQEAHESFDNRITGLEDRETERRGRAKTWELIGAGLVLIATVVEPIVIWVVSRHGGH